MIQLTRYLRPPQIKVELETETPQEIPEGWSHERFVWSVKERVILELVALLDASGRIANPTKLLTDLINRERKASTAIGHGIAIPHVRTMQARDFVICLARSTPGVEFDAPDGRPVHIFFGVVAPPYDDKLYLEVYKEIGTLLSQEEARQAIMRAATPHEMIKVILDVTR
ncbi:MAG: PTS sugar transporter subunit IIA [Planctomycetes bacterium]|nr:PTS sugar transporter subunit IIA [Planctomycetota bacterium]